MAKATRSGGLGEIAPGEMREGDVLKPMVMLPLTCQQCGGDLLLCGVAHSTPGIVHRVVLACSVCSWRGCLTATLRPLREREEKELLAALAAPGPILALSS